jgi:D-inositol-3-phosphate glycosyltransferase
MKRIAVGVIEPVGGYGGMDYYDYGLAMGLGANDVEVFFYTSLETTVRNFLNVETRIYFKKMWKRHFFIKVFKYLAGHFFAINDVKKKEVEIIHLHFFTFRSIDLLILWFARLRKLKIIVTIHDIDSFYKKANRFIERKCFDYIDGIIVHNQSSFNVLNSKFNVAIPTAIIPHGNYLPFIDVVSKKEIKKKDKFTLLFFGQIKKVKGLDILLEALSILNKEGCEVELIIAGKAWKSDLNVYENLIKDLNIGGIVKTDFRYIPDEEVSGFYNQADLVVLPYRKIYQSGVLLLTLSYGKPVLCSDLDPFKEIVTDKENGFLFENENPIDLACKIQELASNSSALDKVSANSNVMIRDKFDWINIGRQTKQFYLELIENAIK